MATEILMPALSPTMEEGTLSKWLVKEGDTVSSGDLLAEVETDKATMEFEAVDEGIIGKLLVAEGAENVAVNTAIAVLLEEGETLSDSKYAATKAEIQSVPEPRSTLVQAPLGIAMPTPKVDDLGKFQKLEYFFLLNLLFQELRIYLSLLGPQDH